MAESLYESSGESSESSEIYDVSTSEFSTPSESDDEEDYDASDAGCSTSRGKRKAPAITRKCNKKTNPKGNNSTATASSSKPPRPKKRKEKSTALSGEQMDEISSWIFSTEEAKDVEDELRLKLLEDRRAL